MGRPKKIINNTNIPQHEIDAIARCLLPYMLQTLESVEGQNDFAKWKAEQAEMKLEQSKSKNFERK